MPGVAIVALKAAAISSILFLISGCISNVGSDSESDTPAGAKSNGNFMLTLSSNLDEPWSTDVSRQELVEIALYKLFWDLDLLCRRPADLSPEKLNAIPLLLVNFRTPHPKNG